MQLPKRRQLATVLVAVCCIPLSLAQTLQYRVVEVGNRVSITVPAHWRVKDASERQNIAASADAPIDPSGKASEPMHVSSLSVVSTPEPPQAIIRVSFVVEPGSQAELKQELAGGKERAVAEIASVWREDSKTLAAAMAKQGMRYLGNERFDFQPLGSKTAVVTSYRRTSARDGSPYLVTQYHVPMGTDKVLITLSLQESSALLVQPILDRVKNSIVIRR